MRAMQTLLLATLLAGAATLSDVPLASADPADDLIGELMCPSATGCQPLATSDSPEAAWMRAFIRAKVAEGWSRERIVSTLACQYGEEILPAPPRRGFGLVAWITPYATILGGAAVLGVLMVGWLRERRLNDAYLRAEMAGRISRADQEWYDARLRRELELFE